MSRDFGDHRASTDEWVNVAFLSSLRFVNIDGGRRQLLPLFEAVLSAPTTTTSDDEEVM
jgi:hypothetical protein